MEDAFQREIANEDFITGVIDIYYSAPNESDSEEDFNEYLKESLLELKEYDKEQDMNLEQITNEHLSQSEFPLNDISLSQNRASTAAVIPDPTLPAYNTAIAAYKAGIAVVDVYGHWQTANYMRHAIVPPEHRFTTWTPSTYYSNNDEWASIVNGNELIGAYYSQLKAEAFVGGKSSGTISGTFTFSGGHLYTSLKNVNYVVTYKLQSNGNYYTKVKVTDTFDFKWELKGYDTHFGAGFGNNYAYLVQEANYIRPYKIEIVDELSR